MFRPTFRLGGPSRLAVVSTLAAALIATMAAPAVAATGYPPTDAAALRQRALAATCAHCHGTDGQALDGQSTARLAGRRQDELLALLMAFRKGERPATIMHQITRGYSPEQLASLAAYFAGQR